MSIVDYCHASVQKRENVICISVFKLREQSISAIVVYFLRTNVDLNFAFFMLDILLCVYYGIKWAKHVIAIDPHRIDCCVSVSCGRGNTGIPCATNASSAVVAETLLKWCGWLNIPSCC